MTQALTKAQKRSHGVQLRSAVGDGVRICFRDVKFRLKNVPSLPLDDIAVAKFSNELAKQLIKTWPKELAEAVRRKNTCTVFAQDRRSNFVPSLDESELTLALTKTIASIAIAKAKPRILTTAELMLR